MNLKNQILKNSLLIAVLIIIGTYQLNSARIKDISVIEGFTGTQVIGYGLVTGLNNTGDNQMTTFTVQSVSNMLKRFGLTVPQSNPRIRNVAAVMVTATIPSFSKKGSKIDIQVSSIGDATSLQGGVLIITPLSFNDGTIIGMAQGAVSVGGYDYQSLGSRISKNFVTSGLVPNGLILEKSMNDSLNQQLIRINLKEPDFSTSYLVSKAINFKFANSASAIDATSIEVKVPTGSSDKLIGMISEIENLSIEMAASAKVVINERTGIIVIGGNVELLPVVIALGGLEIIIQKEAIFPQMPSIGGGAGGANNGTINNNYMPYGRDVILQFRKAQIAKMQAQESQNESKALDAYKPGTNTVQQLATALNNLKVSPRDLISIFQALKQAGSLQGELIVQ